MLSVFAIGLILDVCDTKAQGKFRIDNLPYLARQASTALFVISLITILGINPIQISNLHRLL